MSRTHFEAVAHRKDGSFALASSALTGQIWDGNLWVFDSIDEFKKCPNLYMFNTRLSAGISDILWLTDEQRLLVALDSGELEIWNCRPPGNGLEMCGCLKAHDDMALCMCQLGGVAGKEDKVVSGGADGSVILWDTASSRQLRVYKGHTHMVLSVAANPQASDSFVTASEDGTVKLWDLRLPKPACQISACRSAVYTSVAWSKDLLALGSRRGTVDIMDVREGEYFLFASYQPHSRAVHRITFAPWNSDFLASISDDTNVQVHSISTNQVVYKYAGHVDFVHGVSWNPAPNGRDLVTCGWDGQVLHHKIPDAPKEGVHDTTSPVAMLNTTPPVTVEMEHVNYHGDSGLENGYDMVHSGIETKKEKGESILKHEQ